MLNLEGRVGSSEQNEKQMLQAEGTVHKGRGTQSTNRQGPDQKYPVCCGQGACMGFILRAVALYEDFGSVYTSESGWGRRDFAGLGEPGPSG